MPSISAITFTSFALMALAPNTMLTTFELEIPADYDIEWDHTSLQMPTDDFPATLRPLGR